ncbi:TIGR03757 family integrating conjugative element protein [Methylotuvimicrobium sp. KM1]|uniref:TIGR03757 family integrating conjugative element protein n=1 Tax=Methylotuvimicrobium sp. KM1 TaxID=3377707 RepID=UPI00384B4099
MTSIKSMIIVPGLTVSVMTAVMPLPVRADEQGLVIEAIHSDAFSLTGVDALAGQGIEVKIYNLDDAERLTANLAIGLPPDQEQAKAALERRFKEQGMEAVQKHFMQAFQGRIVGVQYGISRYPAIVFDHGRAVVYGVTDLNRAVAIYREWRRNNP